MEIFALFQTLLHLLLMLTSEPPKAVYGIFLHFISAAILLVSLDLWVPGLLQSVFFWDLSVFVCKRFGYYKINFQL